MATVMSKLICGRFTANIADCFIALHRGTHRTVHSKLNSLGQLSENHHYDNVRIRIIQVHWLTAKKGVHQFRFFLSNMRTPKSMTKQG